MSLATTIINAIKTHLGQEERLKLRTFQALRFRGLQQCFCRLTIGSNLPALAIYYGTDKWGSHWYAQHYARHFAPVRRKTLTILEIGVGGYDDPQLGGGSLRMWRTYFPNSRIFGIDLYDKSAHDERRIKTFRGSQVDEHFLHSVLANIGAPDIIIDDGSHKNEHVIRTFKILFPRLKGEGFYAIEDTQTSYWSRMGGSSGNLDRPDTTMGFCKKLVDGLNYTEYESDDYTPRYFDKHVMAIHFYHNLVVIQKQKTTT